jgi:uncharacterized SAM-binding protein YcdF (DUF218 family)
MLVRIGTEVQEVPRALSRDLVRLGAAAVVGGLIVGGYATYRIWDQGERDERRPADAIVILGAAQYDGRPSPVYRARLEHGVKLWQERWAPLIVVTGGKREGDRTTEAAVGREFALDLDVPEAAILSEDRGRNTVESLRAVAALLRQNEIHEAIFVSDPTHMLRVLRIARDEGIAGWGSPTRQSPRERDVGRRLEATVHELGALTVYFLGGWPGA